MKTFNEKEKKLQDALNKLSNIDIQKINNLNSSDQKSMEEQKNQLEIEKIEIENKYNELEQAYEKLKLQLEEIHSKTGPDESRPESLNAERNETGFEARR